MEDTVTRGKQEREKQGPWEVEVSYGGEADLHKHLICCDKNPGHQKFVPVDQFNVDHLPPGCHDNDLVDFVRALSDLTVRVSLDFVSWRRPPVSIHGKPFPCYRERGRNMTTVGTGLVYGVDKYPDGNNLNKMCTCKECVNSPTPKTQFAHIEIATAAHVVCDNLEAAHTKCHLFFDKGSTPDACSGVAVLTGGSIRLCEIFLDMCLIIYVTHDLDLADRLDKMVKHYSNLEKRLYDKHNRLEEAGDDLLDARENLTIIVSHPHGCSKQVSVGYLIDRFVEQWSNTEISIETDDGCNDASVDECKDGSDDEDFKMTSLRYTTPTCPGSSGAHVCVVTRGPWFIGNFLPVHCGNCEENRKLNYSQADFKGRFKPKKHRKKKFDNTAG